MNKLKVNIHGISPLLMHSNVGVNPMHPLSKQMKAITSKRKKTDEDLENMANLEYRLGLYYDEKIGVYVPAVNVEATIREGAKKQRKGKDAKCTIFVEPDYIPLDYGENKTVEELLLDYRFRDARPCKVNRGSSILRTRPRFDNWNLEFIINYDPKIMSVDEVVSALDVGGREIGLCDYRPRYGRFECSIEEI